MFQRRYQRGTHYRELQQMLSRTIGIGTQIEHAYLPFFGWQIRSDSGSVDARYGFQHVTCGCHQRAGITRADTGRCLAALDQIDGHAHR